MRARELTEIEMALVRRVFGTLLEQLTVTWDELVGVSFGLLELESQISTIHLAPPSEPTLVMTIEVKMDGASSTLSLVFPYRAIESVLPQLSGSQYGEAQIDDSSASAVRAGVAGVDVELRAEVASTHIPIDEVLDLKPGDVLRFRVPAADGVQLYAGHVPAHRARPGRNGNWRAVQIVERMGGEPMTTDEALAQARRARPPTPCVDVLRMFCADGVERDQPTVLPERHRSRWRRSRCRPWPHPCPTSTASPAATSS